jgi:hypothetical protein
MIQSNHKGGGSCHPFQKCFFFSSFLNRITLIERRLGACRARKIYATFVLWCSTYFGDSLTARSLDARLTARSLDARHTLLHDHSAYLTTRNASSLKLRVSFCPLHLCSYASPSNRNTSISSPPTSQSIQAGASHASWRQTTAP